MFSKDYLKMLDFTGLSWRDFLGLLFSLLLSTFVFTLVSVLQGQHHQHPLCFFVCVSRVCTSLTERFVLCFPDPAQSGAQTPVPWGSLKSARAPPAPQTFPLRLVVVSPPAAPGHTPPLLWVRACLDMFEVFNNTAQTWLEITGVCVCSRDDPRAAGSLLLPPAEPRASQPQLFRRSVHTKRG